MKKASLILVILFQFGLSTPAQAAFEAISSKGYTVNSGSWSVIATGVNQTTVNAAYTLVWTVSTGTAYNFFVFRNTGSLSLNSFTVEVSQVQFGGSGKPNDTVFELCRSGIWNPATNTCSGTIQIFGRASDIHITPISLTFSSGSEMSMRASTATNVKNSYTTTLNLVVNRSQVRANTVSNS